MGISIQQGGSGKKNRTAIKYDPVKKNKQKREVINQIDSQLLQDIKMSLSLENEKRTISLFENLHYTDQAALFDLLKSDIRDRLLTYMINYEINPYMLLELTANMKSVFVSFLGFKKIASCLNKLNADDVINFIECLDLGQQLKLLKKFPPEDRKNIRVGLSYPERSAGRIMELDYPAVTTDQTIADVLTIIRENSDIFSDRIYDVMVINEEQKVIGMVSMMNMLLLDHKTKISSIMDADLHTVNALNDKMEVVYLFNKYNINTLPVIDDDNQLIGSISIDTVRYLAEQEIQDEALKMGGVIGEEDEGIFKTTKNRFTWLFINLATASGASWIISMFESTIHKITALAVFIPIIISMGLNAGSQTITVIIRAMATRELNENTFSRYLTREFMMSAFNSCVLSLLCFLGAFFFYKNLGLAIIFGTAIFVTMIITAISAVFSPVLMKKIGTDPAVTSSVVLTTIIDVVAFFSLLFLAKHFLIS